MAKIVNKTKVITGPRTRWSYANVWDPKSINGGTPKYSVSLIIPKSDKKTVEAIKAAIQAAYEAVSYTHLLYCRAFRMRSSMVPSVMMCCTTTVWDACPCR